MVRLLVESGACILATTVSDDETAAEKCEEDEEGFRGCSEYLYSELHLSRHNYVTQTLTSYLNSVHMCFLLQACRRSWES